MAFNADSNRKISDRLKEQYGFDEHGKSIFHKQIGKRGGEAGKGYFAQLKKENPHELRAISRKGARNKAAKQEAFKYGLHADEAHTDKT